MPPSVTATRNRPPTPLLDHQLPLHPLSFIPIAFHTPFTRSLDVAQEVPGTLHTALPFVHGPFYRIDQIDTLTHLHRPLSQTPDDTNTAAFLSSFCLTSHLRPRSLALSMPLQFLQVSIGSVHIMQASCSCGVRHHIRYRFRPQFYLPPSLSLCDRLLPVRCNRDRRSPCSLTVDSYQAQSWAAESSSAPSPGLSGSPLVHILVPSHPRLPLPLPSLSIFPLGRQSVHIAAIESTPSELGTLHRWTLTIWTPLIAISTYLRVAVHYNMLGYYITEPELGRLERLPELAAQPMKAIDEFDGTVSRVWDLSSSGQSRDSSASVNG